MALADEVKSRCAKRLVQLTNPDDRDATTINATILGLAVDDIEAEFKVLAGVAYDNSNDTHVAYGFDGVVLKLLAYMGQSPSVAAFQSWKDTVFNRLRLVTGNNRIKPESSSRLTPAQEAPDGAIVRPYFDLVSSFVDLVPDQDESGDPRGWPGANF
jgi:hypothetical protein